MKMTATPRDKRNGNNKFGLVLVLFVLSVIASRIVNRTAQADNPQRDIPIGIAGSVGFNVYNESVFTLTVPTNGLFGDFEHKPPAHTIPPGGSYNYQVSTNLSKTSIANIYYNYEYQYAGQTRKGDLILDLVVNTSGLGPYYTVMRLYPIGPINYRRAVSYPENVWIIN
ncbi:hypothetical protein M3223_14695 [Paenibacillus pasadenensis]|uniref:hypothetical protein n=1 Tax=Paenibacillus pasadenensis TaxID=217090 RepID=UPI00203C9B16|nr:hypothetical protein [Paenibacillus pasadenensis]MCM3748597.1 hypothetical protein [Paenibacillus pasadenensis]